MRLAVLSDVHANNLALDAVFDEIDNMNVNHIFIAGDLVGYYYWPRPVIERLMNDSRVRCIRGNHENILKQCLNDPVLADSYRKKYGSGYIRCCETLDCDMLDWLDQLPASMEIEIEGVSFYMSHGALGSTDTYLYPDAPTELLHSNYSHCNFTIFGHTHYPLIHHHNSQLMINPGSTGQARDRGGTASYMLINLDNRTVQPRRVPFDVEPIIEASRKYDPDLPYLEKILKR